MNKWAWQTAITDTTTDNREDPSLQRFIRWERGDKAYLWIKNTSVAALTLGDVVFKDITDTTNLAVKRLGESNTNSDGMVGVVTSTAGIAVSSYGWIQVYGVNTGINTLGVAAANEVQTLTPTTNASAGQFSIRVPNVTGEGTTGPIVYSASTATIQTALDLASGVANGIVVTASGNPLATAAALTFTYSGTGFASLPWTQTAKIETAGLTGTTKVLTVRTTPGVAASAIGDTLVGVSGQFYVTKGAVTGVAPPVKSYIESLVTYATATPALKTGFIRCLRG